MTPTIALWLLVGTVALLGGLFGFFAGLEYARKEGKR